MKKTSLAILFLAILLLAACQEKREQLTFNGSGDNWSAEVTVYQDEGEERYQIELRYLENNFNEVGAFRYYVKAKNNGIVDYGGDHAELDKEGVYLTRALASNSPSTRMEDELVVTIEWNDRIEVLTLTSR